MKSVPLQDIDNELDCQDNAGGVIIAYFFPHKDVATWPDEPTGENITMEEFGKLTGDVALAAGKNAVKFEITPDKGSFEITEIGELGGKSHQMDLTIYRTGITAKILGFMGVTKNMKMAGIVVDANKNKFLMGDELVGMFRNGGDGAKTGSARADLAGTGLKFTYPCNNPRIYTGEIDQLLKPAPNPVE